MEPALRNISDPELRRTVGSTVNISCQADGLPEPRVVWRRNGSVVLLESDVERQRWEIINERGSPGFRTEVPTDSFVSSRLIIKRILVTDNHTQLSCSAINSFGQSVTNNYTLIVQSGEINSIQIQKNFITYFVFLLS